MSSIQYEVVTIEKMVRIYCRKKHGNKNDQLLCNECDSVLSYARERLLKCPFGDEKGACADCSIHCYNKEMRENIKRIMRFSGPRMMVYYPMDFLRHIFVDRHRKTSKQ